MREIKVLGAERLVVPHLLRVRVVIISKRWWRRKGSFESHVYTGCPSEAWLNEQSTPAPQYVSQELNRAYVAAMKHLVSERERGAVVDDGRFAEPILVQVRPVSRPSFNVAPQANSDTQ
jgi:hypothetical protein